MAKRKPSKPPPRREASDSFTVTIDGKEYQPHAGEWIDWRGRGTVGSLIVSLRLQKLLRVSGLDAEEAEETSGLYEQVCRDIADFIVGWSWTDDSSEPYPSPPGPEVIRSLSYEELFYLVGLRFGGSTEEESKNGSTPSTSRSKGRKAETSQPSG